MSKSKKRDQPQLDLPLSENPAEAETGNVNIVFTWAGLQIILDPTTFQMGGWAYAIRRISNERLSTYDRVNAAIDLFENTIGEEQLSQIVNLNPDLFDNEAKLASFWTALIKAVHGAEPGES